MHVKKKIIGFNLLFNSLGGSREQIKGLLNNINLYDNYKIIIFSTLKNKIFIEKIKSKNLKIIYGNFLLNNVLIRVLYEQIILPFLCIVFKIDLMFCPGNLSPIFLTKKKIQWIGTIGPFEREFYKNISYFKKIKYFTNKHLMISSAKTSDYVIFESNYAKNLFVKKFNINEDKCKVITIGKSVKNNKINKKNKSLEFSIACVSHIYAYKNFEVLIEAANILKREKYNFKIYVAGSIQDKKYFKKLNNQISKYDLINNIIFLEEVSREKVFEIYQNCFCLINTSPIENFAYTLVEAMSCGVPIISTNTTAMPETCKDAALYFSPNDYKKLSSSIKNIFNSENLRKKLSQLSIKRASEIYDYETSNKKTIELISSLLKDIS